MGLGRDGRNLDGCILLAVSPAALSTCLRLVHEANNLRALSGSYDLGRDLGTSQRSLARHHIGAINNEERRERDARTHSFAEKFCAERLSTKQMQSAPESLLAPVNSSSGLWLSSRRGQS